MHLFKKKTKLNVPMNKRKLVVHPLGVVEAKTLKEFWL